MQVSKSGFVGLLQCNDLTIFEKGLEGLVEIEPKHRGFAALIIPPK
jgi:hypothetical protein